MKNKLKIMFAVALIVCFCFGFCSCGANGDSGAKEISVLLLPHFETGEMMGDFPGEAQLFYEEYLADSESYELEGGYELFYGEDNGVAMCVTGSGKVNNAAALLTVLTDSRFDCSKAYLMGIGCAGGAVEYSTIGDVCLAAAVCDNDLGHTGDPRDLTEDKGSKWFHDSSYDDCSYKELNLELVEELYDLVKDTELQTTELSRGVMRDNFGDAEWAVRDPKVILGTCMSSDNFWKGTYDHDKAVDIAEYYGTKYPYAVTEMEDIALADIADRFGMLDRTVIIRCNVNTDVFMGDETPESLWGGIDNFNEKVEGENTETLDIFEPAMHNNFAVGSIIIDYLLTK